MKKRIVVGTMNIQNKYRLHQYDGLDDKGKDNAELLKRFLIENNIDVLGTQELVRRFIERASYYLKPDYKIYGDYRYGNNFILKKIDIIDKFNETSSVITKHKVLKNKTYLLPWLPTGINDIFKSMKNKSLRPRVVTSLIIDIKDFGTINFINTHLDHRMNIIQIRQLNYLQKMIEKSKYPVILTGDFNMDLNMPRFKKFVDNLDEIGYKRALNNKKTYKHQKDELPIDHIFIPSNWTFEKIEVMTDSYLKDYSDHYPLLAEISKND